jgi:hypothetical protein
MKTPLLALLALCAAAVSAEMTQEELRTTKTVNLHELDGKPDLFAGKVVKVRFTSRGERVEKVGEGWKGTIHQDGKDKWAFGVDVTLPQAAFTWFNRLPSTYEKNRSMLVFARAEKGLSGLTLELLGREAKITSKGVELTW